MAVLNLKGLIQLNQIVARQFTRKYPQKHFIARSFSKADLYALVTSNVVFG